MAEIYTSTIASHNRTTNKALLNPKYTNLIIDAKDEQLDREKAFLKEVSSCPNRIKKLQNNLSNLQAKELKSYVGSQFFNPDVMKAAMCVSESIYYSPQTKGDISFPNIRIRNWIRNLDQIGAESVEGYAMRGSLKDADNFFIVKAPRNPKSEDLIHEYFVGVFGLNKLRSYVPNFAYVFGGFACSPPIIDPETKKVVAWCNNNKANVNYILYENIAPAVSFDTYVETCTPTQFLEMYLQILYALHIAEKKIQFTHYDLHGENVLIRDIGKSNFLIKYETENGLEYLLTDRVATIIDFGMAHIVHEDEHYGSHARLSWGVYPDRSYTMHDAYKLLLFAMRSAYRSGNNGVFKTSSAIFEFFNRTEDPVDIVTSQRKFFYYIPWTKTFGKYSTLHLAKYIREIYNIPFIVSEPGGLEVLSCLGTEVCTSLDGVMTKIGVTGDPHPYTFFELFDLLTTLDEERTKEVIEKFPYDDSRYDFLLHYKERIHHITTLLEPGVFKIYQIDKSPPASIFNQTTLKQYKEYISVVAEIYDEFNQIYILSDIGRKIAELFNDDELISSLSDIYVRVKNLKPKATTAIRSIIKDKKWIDLLFQHDTGKIEDLIDRDRSLGWYRTGLTDFSYMLGIK